jgi:hypothetical protein
MFQQPCPAMSLAAFRELGAGFVQLLTNFIQIGDGLFVRLDQDIG